MFLNIILGFIIPWVVTLIIVRERKLIYYIAPFAGVVSFVVDDLGFYYFWSLYPFNLINLSGIPFNIGLFCLYPCVCIELLRRYDFRPYIGLSITSLILTLMEGSGVIIGRVIYFNNWNIVATYFSYFTSLFITYTFYTILKKQNII